MTNGPSALSIDQCAPTIVMPARQDATSPMAAEVRQLALPLNMCADRDPALSGDHAARLVTAARAGINIAAGAILTTRAIDDIRSFGLPSDGYVLPGDHERSGPAIPLQAALRDVWHRSALSGLFPIDLTTSPHDGYGRVPELVATALTTWPSYVQAVRRIAITTPPDVELAIVAQPHTEFTMIGTAGPVSRTSRRIRIEHREAAGAGAFGPAVTTVVGSHGRGARGRPASLERNMRRDIAALTRKVERLFGSQTRLEWGLNSSGVISLLRVMPEAGALSKSTLL